MRSGQRLRARRALSRQRERLLLSPGRHVQHLQKARTQMKLPLANVSSDDVGETGAKILRALVAGERDGQALAAFDFIGTSLAAPATRRKLGLKLIANPQSTTRVTAPLPCHHLECVSCEASA